LKKKTTTNGEKHGEKNKDTFQRVLVEIVRLRT